MTNGEIVVIRKSRELVDKFREESERLLSEGELEQSEDCLTLIDEIYDVIEKIVGKPLLTDDERMYIEDLIRPFRSMVFGIRKAAGDSENRMGYIMFLSEDYIGPWSSDPYIPIGDMEFRGLELNQDDCFEELGIITKREERAGGIEDK